MVFLLQKNAGESSCFAELQRWCCCEQVASVKIDKATRSCCERDMWVRGGSCTASSGVEGFRAVPQMKIWGEGLKLGDEGASLLGALEDSSSENVAIQDL